MMRKRFHYFIRRYMKRVTDIEFIAYMEFNTIPPPLQCPFFRTRYIKMRTFPNHRYPANIDSIVPDSQGMKEQVAIHRHSIKSKINLIILDLPLHNSQKIVVDSPSSPGCGCRHYTMTRLRSSVRTTGRSERKIQPWRVVN
jgi:hypothetical protein